MNLQDIYIDLKEKLPSKQEALSIIEHSTGKSEADLIAHPDFSIHNNQITEIRQVLKRRLSGEPLSRILGTKEFWGLPFKVTPDVLDPRPDTETLVEAVIRAYPDRQTGLKFLDLGTGTGCIPIALLTEYPNASAVAVDFSHAAALVAVENAREIGVSDRFFVVQGDWMTALKPKSFDVITSNPPYILESEIKNLMDEVKNHDPILALSGGKDGLDDYKKIISQLKIHLKRDGVAFLEIGLGQLESLERLVDDSTLCLCDSVADIAGIPRVVEIRCGDK